MKPSVVEIQNNNCSIYDASMICSFDLEFAESATKPLIHQRPRFLYFTEGAGTIQINGRPHSIGPNTIVLILPWEISEITEVTKMLVFNRIIYDYEYIAFALHHFYYLSDQELISITRIMEENPVLYLQGEAAREVQRAVRCLQEELGVESASTRPRKRELSNAFVVNKLVDLVISCIRFASESAPLQSKDSGSAAQANSRAIFRYLYSHLDQHLTIKKVALALYMSESSVSKCIFNLTAMSFNEVLNEMRLTKASDLLTKTDMSLGEVAKICGYCDAPHLAKVFAAREGVTAREFRKATRGKDVIMAGMNFSKGVEVVAYIRANYNSQSLSVNSVMRQFGLTSQELNQLLLFHVGKPFGLFLNEIRINQACQYLLTTDWGVLQVAMEVGYNNVRTFNRNFVKLKNITPENFKKTTLLQQNAEMVDR